MRILIVSDAWHPQVNGVVRTLNAVVEQARHEGHAVAVIGPADFRTVPCPSYPEIRLALCTPDAIGRRIAQWPPDAIHIATEGPLGLAARWHCLRHGLRFTTAFHTKFPEYAQTRTGLPARWSYAALRRFHAPSSGVLVAAASIRAELTAHGFTNLKPWSRGVDADLFRPSDKSHLMLPRPISVCVGRLAVDKNIDAFLALALPGTKLVIGDGPDARRLRAKYPDAMFTGRKTGTDLARTLAASDVLVFPSLTDTFGLVLLEALACGVPIAAFPVPGPLDVVGDAIVGEAPVGRLDWDLGRAIRAALPLSGAACRTWALRFTWARTTALFLDNLVPLRAARPRVPTREAA